MPELPEVETIVRILKEGGEGANPLCGRVVEKVDLLWQRSLAVPSSQEFQKRFPGQKVVDISRRGKFIVIQFDQDYLLIHLRMSGDLHLSKSKDEKGVDIPFGKHDRCVIHFKDGSRLVFNDPRKFGRLWLVADPQEILVNLGPEPLAHEFTGLHLYDRLHARHRQLKPLLMDQSFLAGLGNIYADEALFCSRLHPLCLSDEVTREQADELCGSIRDVIEEGIRRNGASIDWVYRGGEYQNRFQVYQRTGLPCYRCGTTIEKIIVGQRSTHFCPSCQSRKG
jgi:formamidopyrimidine-DNA glycosylase